MVLDVKAEWLKEKQDAARAMKADGVSIDQIQKYTGLTPEDIEALDWQGILVKMAGTPSARLFFSFAPNFCRFIANLLSIFEEFPGNLPKYLPNGARII